MSFNSNVFFTRLHVRYNRDKFPQDLFFQETPNAERFQCRYVVNNPPENTDFACDNGQQYIKDLKNKRQNEIDELAVLTGWESTRYAKYINEYDQYLTKDESKASISIQRGSVGSQGLIAMLGVFALFFMRQIIRKRKEEKWMP